MPPLRDRENEIDHLIAMAQRFSVIAWEFTGTKENHATPIFSGSYCQVQKIGGSSGSFYLHASKTMLDGQVAQIWHPAVTGCADDVAEGITDKAFRPALPKYSNFDKDWRPEISSLFGEVNGLDELLRCVAPSPIAP